MRNNALSHARTDARERRLGRRSEEEASRRREEERWRRREEERWRRSEEEATLERKTFEN
jgi:hypothetical protein